ncbi:rich repeat and nacht domain-containing protein [Anaeramoeba flamelloides]|uniref:Rich repeat and nacht domain-containing protein n=1 Tax=Anaeramoeba flamelloides TaxID=1746091 RepID=A0ABQ8YID9_9EUKA|nr:rich repeat and nacht domain-containing protein [Anaeramoeba flamelloides]
MGNNETKSGIELNEIEPENEFTSSMEIFEDEQFKELDCNYLDFLKKLTLNYCYLKQLAISNLTEGCSTWKLYERMLSTNETIEKLTIGEITFHKTLSLSIFSGLTHNTNGTLKSLSFQKTTFEKESLSYFARYLAKTESLIELEFINIQRAEFLLCLAEGLAKNQSIKTVRLYSSDQKPLFSKFYQYLLDYCPNLELIDYSSPRSTSTPAIFSNIKRMRNLKTINLPLQKLNSKATKSLITGLTCEEGENLQALTRLNISGCTKIKAQQQSDLLQALAENCPDLKQLNLNYLDLSPKACDSLCLLIRKCTHLNTLYLRHNSLKANNIASIGEAICSIQNRKLKRLDLSTYLFNQEMAIAMSEYFSKDQQLKALFLNNLHLQNGESGELLIQSLLKMKSLKFLSLNSSLINEQTSKALKQLIEEHQSLLTLDISNIKNLEKYSGLVLSGFQNKNCSISNLRFLQKNNPYFVNDQDTVIHLQNFITSAHSLTDLYLSFNVCSKNERSLKIMNSLHKQKNIKNLYLSLVDNRTVNENNVNSFVKLLNDCWNNLETLSVYGLVLQDGHFLTILNTIAKLFKNNGTETNNNNLSSNLNAFKKFKLCLRFKINTEQIVNALINILDTCPGFLIKGISFKDDPKFLIYDYLIQDKIERNFQLQNGIENDLYKFFQMQILTDLQLNNIYFHSFWLKLWFAKIDANQIIESFEKFCGNDNKVFNNLLVWIYSGISFDFEQTIGFNNTIGLQLNPLKKNISITFKMLFQENETKDFKIIHKNGKAVWVHRFVLAVRSQFFSQLLQNNNQANTYVDESGLSFRALQLLVEFLYTNTIQFTKSDDISSLSDELKNINQYFKTSNKIKVNTEKYFLKNLVEIKEHYIDLNTCTIL